MKNDGRRGDSGRAQDERRGAARRTYPISESGEYRGNGARASRDAGAPRVGAVRRGVPVARRVGEGEDARRGDENRGEGRRFDYRESFNDRESGNRSENRGERGYGKRGAGFAPKSRDAQRGESAAGEAAGDRRAPYGAGRYEGGYGAGRKYDNRRAFRADLPAARRAEAEEADGAQENEQLLVGRNPIREALKAGRTVEKLLVAQGDLSGAARDIVRMAREAGVVVQFVERYRLDQIYPAHQGLLAFRSARAYATIEDILARARERGEEPLVVVLDQVTDPHNLGAIIRSSECAGAHGVIIPERRAAGLTPACEKAAAGALAHLPVARVKNLNRALEELKRAGLWIVAAALEGENALTADLSGPLALVIGSEGEGISRLTLSLCDRRVTLPMLGKISSLNASVAAGVLLYQVVRARGGGA